MPTIKEMNARLDALNKKWVADFRPLYRAGAELKRAMFKRIFGKGAEGGFNSNMRKLPTRPYSTKPIYVDPKLVRNAPASFKRDKPTTNAKGKVVKGKKIESLYFAGGYAELKSKTSAKLPLQLTGRLAGGFFKSDVLKDGLSFEITLPESELEKATQLEYRYGTIFQPTDNEEIKFLELHGNFVAEAINDMLK